MLKKILKFLNHERCQVAAVFLCVLLTLWGLSCEPKVQSLRDPTRKITRLELQAEVDAFYALAEQRFNHLNAQDKLKALVFNSVLLWSQTGTFNPMGLIPTLIGIFGIGAVADNVKKRRDIKKLNNT